MTFAYLCRISVFDYYIHMFYKVTKGAITERLDGMLQFHMQRPKRFALLFVGIIGVLAVAFSSFFYLNSQNSYAGKTENISFGTFLGSSEPYAALAYVAQEQHFFDQNGINLTIIDYTSATKALNAALSNQVNLAISSEYAFVVTNVLKHGDLHIIGTVDKSESVSVVGRRDLGIENISDLQGKRIGLTLQIAPQFYLATFLELNNVNTQNLTLVNIPTTEYVPALVNGTVDAVVVSESSIPQIEAQLPNDTVTWSVQSGQLLDMVVSCRTDWINQHPELVTRFLKSLAQAEAYVINNPTQAETIIQKRLNATDSYMAEILPNHQFSLSLDQSLVVAMEDELRWMISSNLTNETAIPNFTDYVYLQGLLSVKPESVNIIH